MAKARCLFAFANCRSSIDGTNTQTHTVEYFRTQYMGQCEKVGSTSQLNEMASQVSLTWWHPGESLLRYIQSMRRNNLSLIASKNVFQLFLSLSLLRSKINMLHTQSLQRCAAWHGDSFVFTASLPLYIWMFSEFCDSTNSWINGWKKDELWNGDSKSSSDMCIIYIGIYRCSLDRLHEISFEQKTRKYFSLTWMETDTQIHRTSITHIA